ncbi:hypothetical protein DENIS_0410 [Desulfonema ishimotonii]|uniref:IS1 family transposase n=1 Tax=Desulfonema ishimotonii TaxID=45657 RepID=A0A401FR82_9BACT|nr:hypothetical protein DENIS_0410 [Desulfonema ishimotonii]
MTEKRKGRLTIECDEMWSFVENKDNKMWIWLAKDIDTKEIVGAHTGSRDGEGSRKLWDSLPSFTDNVLFPIQISGLLTRAYFLPCVIVRWEKEAERRIISGASTAP